MYVSRKELRTALQDQLSEKEKEKRVFALDIADFHRTAVEDKKVRETEDEAAVKRHEFLKTYKRDNKTVSF